MGAEEDLVRFESEIELALYEEYRAVLPMFRYVVETERRFYLANEVKVTPHDNAGTTYVDIELSDAWVWDVYRPARFVSSVKVTTFKDVNVELIEQENLSQILTTSQETPGEKPKND